MKKNILFLILAVGLAIPLACSNNNNPTSPAPTATFTFTATTWAQYTATNTPTSTATATPTATNIGGFTSTFTSTPSSTPTNAGGFTSTFTPTFTFTATLTPSNTAIPTNSPTSTPTSTPTPTVSPAPTYAQSISGVVYPNGVAAGGNNLFVAEGDGISTGNQVQIFNNTSLVKTITTYNSTALVSPNGVATNSTGTTFYLVDAGNSSFGGAVYEFKSDGTPVTSWSSWVTTAPPVTFTFKNPEGIAMDNSTNCGGGPCVYVADTGTTMVEVFTTSGSPVTQWNTGASLFDIPSAVAVNSAGSTLCVANAGNGLVQICSNPSTSPTWTTGPTVPNSDLFGIALDSTGNIYLADTENSLVEEYNGTGLISQWNGSPGPLFVSPDGIAITNSGIWVTDWNNGSSNTGSLSEF